MPCLADVFVLLMSFLLIVSAAFAAAPTLEQLEGMLDRAITMMGAFIGDGVPFTPGFEDNLLLLQQVPFLPIIQHIVFLRNPLMHDLIFSNRFTLPTSCRTPPNTPNRSAPHLPDASLMSGDQKPPLLYALKLLPPTLQSPSSPCLLSSLKRVSLK